MKRIQVLGTGCAKCRELFQRCEQALEQYSVPAELEKVEEIERIVEMGVMLTPALVVDGEVLFSGRVPSVEELAELIGLNQ